MDDQEKETAQGRPRASAAAGQALDLQGGVRAGLEGSWVSRSPGDGWRGWVPGGGTEFASARVAATGLRRECSREAIDKGFREAIRETGV